MQISSEKYEELVLDLEKLAREKPASYKLALAALALPVYLSSISPLLLLLVLVTFALFLRDLMSPVALSLVLAVSALAFAAAAFLMPLRFAPPRGITISKVDSPTLFHLIAQISQMLSCPKIEAVYLTADFNASIRSIPEFAFPGKYKHYLFLGLPLMQSLSPEQFRAALTHEMGHLSSRHGKLSAWIYVLRLNLMQMLESAQKGLLPGAALVKKFLAWYFPLFNAYSFVLLRHHEFEADKFAAGIEGQEAAAFSLINSELKQRYIENVYWKNLFNKVVELPEAPLAPFHDLTKHMLQCKADNRVYNWYKQALKRKTSLYRSHPALFDRLNEIQKFQPEKDLRLNYTQLSQSEIEEAWQLEKSAASHYLQDRLAEFENRLDFAWHQAYDQNWRTLHQEKKQLEELLSKYDQLKEHRSLSDEEALHRAELYVQLKEVHEYIPVLEETLLRLPDDLSLNYNMGERLLAEGDMSGVKYLDKVISLDPAQAPVLTELIYESYLDKGEDKLASAYLKKNLQCRKDLLKSDKHKKNGKQPRMPDRK